MSGLESFRCLEQALDGLPSRKDAHRFHEGFQVSTLDILHHEVVDAVRFLHVFEAADDVGMMESGQGFGLAAKALDGGPVPPGE
jgi:hypothetical protein